MVGSNSSLPLSIPPSLLALSELRSSDSYDDVISEQKIRPQYRGFGSAPVPLSFGVERSPVRCQDAFYDQLVSQDSQDMDVMQIAISLVTMKT
ncbi:hypothetical protein M8J76_016533 [Diaphorina citri]|nr:hypothetical protein M8J76_016533 [Diaphorina citri]